MAGDTLMEPEKKACKGCSYSLPVDDFYDDPKNADGKKSQCKDCYNKQQLHIDSRRRSLKKRLWGDLKKSIYYAQNHDAVCTDLILVAERHCTDHLLTDSHLDEIVSVFNGDIEPDTEFLSKVSRLGELHRRKLNATQQDTG